MRSTESLFNFAAASPSLELKKHSRDGTKPCDCYSAPTRKGQQEGGRPRQRFRHVQEIQVQNSGILGIQVNGPKRRAARTLPI